MSNYGVTTSPYPPFFRRRAIGRAASPPTWACYEQIPFDDDEDSESGSEDGSCSEDDGSYGIHAQDDSDSEVDQVAGTGTPEHHDEDTHVEAMEIDEGDNEKHPIGYQNDAKGKQRAVEPEPEMAAKRRHRRKHRESVYTLRPILTIHKSQGFVWNQDLFVPPYIKDRYVASTSPPNSMGFISTSASTTISCLTDYEVEVVEIRVKDGELDNIIP